MIEWRDGQPWSPRFADRYFSAESGLGEARHVFIDGNRLAQRFARLAAGARFRVGETGFGTGLNFVAAWHLFSRCAPAGTALEWHSVERWPLARDELRAALALWPELAAEAAALVDAWPEAPGRRLIADFAAARVRLVVDLADVAAALPSWPAGRVDAWCLDGFAPARNPGMWGAAVLAEVARASRPGATLATYTSAGWVRRGLQAAGFDVRRAPGFGRKREMLVGDFVGQRVA